MSGPLARFGGSIWAVPAYLPYVQDPLGRGALEEAEARLGVSLPASLVTLLFQQNGGYLRASWPGSVSHTLFGIGARAPSLTTHRAWWQEAGFEGYVPDGPELLVPVDGDGHWDLCLDYRRCGPRGEPAVTWVDVELRREERVAATFGAYLDGLVDESSAQSFLLSGVELDEAGARLGAELGLPVEDQGAWAHGYRVLRLAMPGKYEWCWLMPNRVPRGFWREGQEVRTTPTTALRLAEHPTCTVEVGATEGSRGLVRNALIAAGLLDP